MRLLPARTLKGGGLVIGKPARHVSVDEAWDHLGSVTATKDLSPYDIQYADKGSNIRSKSGAGFTPLGPALLSAASVNPDALWIRTWFSSEVVQDAATADAVGSGVGTRTGAPAEETDRNGLVRADGITNAGAARLGPVRLDGARLFPLPFARSSLDCAVWRAGARSRVRDEGQYRWSSGPCTSPAWA
jgi:hypothetical protein